MRKPFILFFAFFLIVSMSALMSETSCENQNDKEIHTSNAKSIDHTNVPVGKDGLTNDQRNIQRRNKLLSEENTIMHAYLINTYTGEVQFHSTVQGKVTSGNKRLQPSSVSSGGGGAGNNFYRYGNLVTINGTQLYTSELPDPQGVYGSSHDYLFWFDVNGGYHQHTPGSGMYLHISSHRLAMFHTALNIDISK